MFTFQRYTTHTYPMVMIGLEFMKSDLRVKRSHLPWILVLILVYLVMNVGFTLFGSKPVYEIVT